MVSVFNQNFAGTGGPYPIVQRSFLVYVWSVVIDQGESDDVLLDSDDGTQNLQPVTLYIPHPTGDAYDLTLSISDASGIELWNTPDPTADTAPLLGNGTSSMTIGPNFDQLTLFIGGIDNAADASTAAMLIMTGQLASNTSGQPSPVGPTQPADLNPVSELADALQVATINDGSAVAGSFLSQADMHGAGAFVPLDNNDWDYLYGTDMNQSGAVVGDKYLLPVTLAPLATAKAGDVYYLEAAAGTRVWKNADRTGLVYDDTTFPANATTTVYIEGIADTTTASFTSELFLDAVIHGQSFHHAASCNITVFTITGPLDVPGNGTYDYSSDQFGTWMTPTGGMAHDNTGNPGVQVITWNNAAEFGEATFSAGSSGNYVWSCQVNVVQITMVYEDFKYGTPEQDPKDDRAVASADPATVTGQAGASINTREILQGPSTTPGGAERGIKWIKFGLVQDVQITYAEALFTFGRLCGTRTYKERRGWWTMKFRGLVHGTITQTGETTRPNRPMPTRLRGHSPQRL